MCKQVLLNLMILDFPTANSP